MSVSIKEGIVMSQPVTGTKLAEIATVSVEPMQNRRESGAESPARNRQQFRLHGIMTATGPLTASEARIQVLTLPALILLWGVVVAVLAAVAL